MFHARTLGEILANEAVGVLVAAALPGVVGRSKVAPQRATTFQTLVVMELSAVVEGDRLEPAWVLAQRA